MARSGVALQQKVDRAVQHHRDDDLVRAEEGYRQVLALAPDHAIAIHLLGAIMLQTGRNAAAVDLLQKAVARLPDQAPLFANLGEAHRRLGNGEKARAALERAIALKPDLAAAHYTLGLTLCREGHPADAVVCFEQAAALMPGSRDVQMSLCEALAELGRLDEARGACARALEIDLGFAEGHNQMGFLQKELGCAEEAIASFRRALECRPDHRLAHSNVVYALPYVPSIDASSVAREAVTWGERHAGTASLDRRPHANNRDPERRLRVGYTSPDFRNHCQALFFIPLLEHRDRSVIEVTCYSWVRRPDDVTDRIRGLSDRFRDVTNLSDREAAELIRADEIDVLVDLTMHMGDNRLPIFASKPAPVQVAWLAYPGTTGLDAMDYRITDVFLDPPEIDVGGWYSEQSVRLPDSFWCYDPLTRVPEVNALPAMRDGRVTFGCLNNFSKTNAGVFALWARVLNAVEGSRLLLLARTGEPRTRVREVFAEAGVAAERIDFVDVQPRAEYLATYHEIDVCLDTFPVNGHTTSLDSFWMGVPVVTLVGPTVLGRAGLCYAKNLGLDGLVATTPDEYVGIAVALARDRPRLAGLRGEVRKRMESSPLMDGPRFARNMESAYRTIWRNWCAENGAGETGVESLAELTRAVAQDPENVAHLSSLSEAYRRLGRLREAVDPLLRALSLRPDFAEGFHSLAVVLRQAREIDGAVVYFERAVDLEPEAPRFHRSLAEALQERGDLQLARPYFACARLLSGSDSPGEDDLLLARALRAEGSLRRSVAHYHCALALDPGAVDAWVELSGALEALGRADGAAVASSRAITLHPRCAMGHATLAAARVLQRRYDEAIDSCQSALAIDPACWLAQFHLGNALSANGEVVSALAAYRRTVELCPTQHAAHSALVFLMPYAPGIDAPAVGHEARSWARQRAEPLASEVRAHTNDRDPERRIRVGYVSPDFREHAVALFLLPLLASHDRQAVEVFCYSSTATPDAVTARLRASADAWRDVAQTDDAAVADLVREDRIDVLIDLTMHASGGRPLLFARKPAPVQICWLAYVGTTGLGTMDYRLTDPHLEPPNVDPGWCTEAPLVLPETFWCYAPLHDTAHEVAPLPAARSGRVTFGSQHSIQKVNDGVLALWGRILREVEGSRLLMVAPEGAKRSIFEAFEREGIDRRRVECLPPRTYGKYLDAYGEIDIGLDTFPCNGATSSIDAFWMGVPVVTMVGQTPAGRAGLSIATNLGLPELVARTEDEYVRAAVRLARDLGRLDQLRRGLRARMQSSPLMDVPRFTRNIEAAYRVAWKKWCRS